jgi:hypothetical protein
MYMDAHREAETLMMEGDRLRAVGRPAEALVVYTQAATRELDALRATPDDRPRTKGVVAVSAVALFTKAAAPDQALSAAYQLLVREDRWAGTVTIAQSYRDCRGAASGRRSLAGQDTTTFSWCWAIARDLTLPNAAERPYRPAIAL